jgi:hypothetical protein
MQLQQIRCYEAMAGSLRRLDHMDVLLAGQVKVNSTEDTTAAGRLLSTDALCSQLRLVLLLMLQLL